MARGISSLTANVTQSGSHVALEPSGVSPATARLDDAIKVFTWAMEYLERMCAIPGVDMDTLSREMAHFIHAVEEAGRDVERELMPDREAIKEQQAEFRRKTDRFFAQSYFMNRARTWPLGYPGDHVIIEKAYARQTLSKGIGALLDRYFLDSTLALGICERRERMRDVLADEMQSRPGAQVLNIGCGPCHEVAELAPVIRKTGAHFTCLDFDSKALDYSAARMVEAGIEQQVEFRKYNALRMISAKKNLREFGRQDIIYSIGLLDYLTDDTLIRLLAALGATLKPSGVFVAVFKDCDRYDTPDYHWLVDWSAFYQRPETESRRLIEQAGLAGNILSVDRTPAGVMIFYRIGTPADAGTKESLQGPHATRNAKKTAGLAPTIND